MAFFLCQKTYSIAELINLNDASIPHGNASRREMKYIPVSDKPSSPLPMQNSQNGQGRFLLSPNWRLQLPQLKQVASSFTRSLTAGSVVFLSKDVYKLHPLASILPEYIGEKLPEDGYGHPCVLTGIWTKDEELWGTICIISTHPVEREMCFPILNETDHTIARHPDVLFHEPGGDLEERSQVQTRCVYELPLSLLRQWNRSKNRLTRESLQKLNSRISERDIRTGSEAATRRPRLTQNWRVRSRSEPAKGSPIEHSFPWFRPSKTCQNWRS